MVCEVERACTSLGRDPATLRRTWGGGCICAPTQKAAEILVGAGYRVDEIEPPMILEADTGRCYVEFFRRIPAKMQEPNNGSLRKQIITGKDRGMDGFDRMRARKATERKVILRLPCRIKQ